MDGSDVGSTPQRQRRRDAYSSIEPLNPIGFWAEEGTWPPEYFEMDFERILARKKSLFSPSRTRSSSSASTPSEREPREDKSASYHHPGYELFLATKGSFMHDSEVGITEQSKEQLLDLLVSTQPIPKDSLFQDDLFNHTCRKVSENNVARVIRDLTPLIVPSAENLYIRGEKHLRILKESVNHDWNNSIPLTGTRPQPDFTVGFAREAFSDEQLAKLSPFIGDFISGDQSFFLATYFIYFPFLTCEVKCKNGSLHIADCQNAHSATLAVRGVVELFRALKRESEVHRQILAFSISHDHRSVRLYGHYPVIDGEESKYYRHLIQDFSVTQLDGKEKWTAYRFTRNIYDGWMPSHFEKICSAVDQLPIDLDLMAHRSQSPSYPRA